jgi:hypothetical protein
VSRIAWEDRHAGARAARRGAGRGRRGRLYVFGGFTSGATLETTARSDAYDAAGGSWQRVPDMPVAVTHAPVVVDGTTIWLLGGYVGDHPGPATAQVWKYDVAAARWSAGPPLPPRAARAERRSWGGSCTSSAGRAATAPTAIPTRASTGSSGSTAARRGSRARRCPTRATTWPGVGLGGLVYAIGGQYGENETTGNQSQVDAYDPASDTWRPRAPLPAPRGHVSSSAVVVGDRIVVMGGTEQGNKASSRWRSTTPRRTRGPR